MKRHSDKKVQHHHSEQNAKKEIREAHLQEVTTEMDLLAEENDAYTVEEPEEDD